MKYRLPPPVKALRKFDVNRPGLVEATRQSLYDFQVYAAAGQTQLTFFQVPKGQAGKTQDDTNLETAGALPRPKTQLIESIEVYFFPGVDIGTLATTLAETEYANDVQSFFESGFLDLFIGSKSYLIEAPIGRFPPKTRMYVNSAHAIERRQATPANAEDQVSTEYAVGIGRPYHLDPEIKLIHTQNFSVTLNWNTAVALPSGQAARVGVVLDGVLYRLSQ